MYFWFCLFSFAGFCLNFWDNILSFQAFSVFKAPWILVTYDTLQEGPRIVDVPPKV